MSRLDSVIGNMEKSNSSSSIVCSEYLYEIKQERDAWKLLNEELHGGLRAVQSERDALRAELDEWKDLHKRHTAMVIPGETDSADAYRKMYFQLRAERDDARENSNKFQMQVMQLRAALEMTLTYIEAGCVEQEPDRPLSEAVTKALGRSNT